MANNNTSSNDCLFDCKEQIRSHISSSCLSIDCEDIISGLREAIDVDKFKAWFDRNKTTFKTKDNIQTYFNRAFFKELERGTFKIEEVKTVEWNATTLFNAMREKDIIVVQADTCYICLMFSAYSKLGVRIDTVQEVNHRIVDSLEAGQTSQDYIKLVKEAPEFPNDKVDWNKLQIEYEAEMAEWNRILAELNSAGGK